MHIRIVCLCLALALPIIDTAEPPTFTPVHSESFDYPAGPLPSALGAWQRVVNTDTAVEIARPKHSGGALRIIDDHSAAADATCRLRLPLATQPGQLRVSVRMMMTKGTCGAVAQDMGLHLFGGGVLLDVFFSRGELKTWQGTGWASLEPPVKWQDGRWYGLQITVNPAMGMADLSVDGVPRKAVSLRRKADRIDQFEITSQRFARGEFWVDDLKIEHALPPELLAQPSEAWQATDDNLRQERWLADRGSTSEQGTLAVTGNALASMRRRILLDPDRLPYLTLGIESTGTVQYTVYLKSEDDSLQPVLLLTGTGSRTGQPFNLAARTGWSERTFADILVSGRGSGMLRIPQLHLDQEDVLPDPYDRDHTYAFKTPPLHAKPGIGPLKLLAKGPAGHHPVTFGVPFPAGGLNLPCRLELSTEAGERLPLQTQALAIWEGGTVRWALLDSAVTLPESGTAELTLTPLTSAPRPDRVMASIEEQPITIQSSLGECRVPGQRFSPLEGLPAPFTGVWDLHARFGERNYRASLGTYRARSETSETLRTTILVEGTLSDGNKAPLQYELRLTFFRLFPRILIEPTFTLACDQSEVQLEQVSLRLGADHRAGALVFGGDREHEIAWDGISQVELVQDQIKHYAVQQDDALIAEGKRAKGWLHCNGYTLANRRFWQQFSKAVRLDADAITVDLWAPEGGTRRFGNGAAKTHALVLDFSGAAPADQAAAFETPVILDPGSDWYATSRGLGEMPVPSSETARMDALYEQACQRRLTERERRWKSSYGMVNFGDIGHINSEIDAHVALFLQWGRTGDRKWLDFALDWALHSQDIDVCHHSANPRQVGIHHSHYPSDHNNGGLTLTHTWIRGQLFRYYLTGDRRSLMAAEKAGRAYAVNMLATGQAFDAGRLGGGIGSRAYGRACWALAELYQTNRNPRHLKTMRQLLSYLAASLREDGAVPASHDGAGEWNKRDECPHMAAICAVGMARYAELSGDTSLQSELERIARWQISRGGMPEKLGIMYHNYPGGETIHFIDACSDMLEAWAYLYDATGDPLYRSIAESVYDNMIEMAPRWVNDWTMGARNVLFYLGRRQRWPPWSVQSLSKTENATRWLQRCQNTDGGFSITQGLPSEMDSTFRAVDALAALGARPKNAQACIAWTRSCRNDDGGYAGEPDWHSNVAWTHMALDVLGKLGEKPPKPADTAAWLARTINEDGGSGASPVTGRIPYHPGWPSSTEYTAYRIKALASLERPQIRSEDALRFFLQRQVAGTGFGHRGRPACPAYTSEGLEALSVLGNEISDRETCLSWLLGLQKGDGGYGWPGGDRGTLRHTFHVLRSLQTLVHGLDPESARKTAGFVLKCQARDGGFGYRPGHPPTVTGTWYAVHINALLVW
ncbi:MAG: hypothetical protein HN742_17485 [Lentisphaerae bacterium]|jgi:prenyltransferase beta subunit|nr:hypothetical protein [Lentisphaerota bacterium]MBT4815999.1 hypothetical protein [Lentisphaerota bacterium]MBT5613179.1 hypothetical protein [Lentisphaerota bacterium]MBT7061848.1 hypothetical protein [Lentisphaerota bacterium]MBT7843674.1 hypothetical protein [Lentisphaerota bacterium]